jgi:hypothetical protein
VLSSEQELHVATIKIKDVRESISKELSKHSRKEKQVVSAKPPPPPERPGVDLFVAAMETQITQIQIAPTPPPRNPEIQLQQRLCNLSH